jgi:CheY-like chemotaxis protein
MSPTRGSKRQQVTGDEHSAGGPDVENEWDYSFQVRPKRPKQNSVLLVDDDPSQLTLLQLMVERAGYHVVTAESGSQALHLLEERPFNVIVADYKMPQMSGFEFVKALRKLDCDWNTGEVPVIVLTACGEDIEFSALEKGADMFCEKFRAESLLVKQIRFLLEM